MKTSTPWLFWRAILALLLTLGFYGLAIGLIILLVMIPYWEVVYLERLDGRIALACLFGALAIAWAIIPRIERFEPPGPRLNAKEHPRLFALIEEVAKATQQRMPSEVYLVANMNAFVTERGGWMGIGSRRVMGLGLPLLQLLSISELKSVLAHEFGHYHSGDTALGPWIYKLRNTIIRTIIATGQARSLVQIPFRLYGDLFLRVTNAISRAQEFAADALAASITGAQPLIEALQKIHRGAAALNAYFQQEYLPALTAGYQPPLARGFAHFMTSAGTIEITDKLLDDELKTGKQNPYDTHPPLRERINAMKNFRPVVGLSDSTTAITLIGDVEKAEKDLLVFSFDDKQRAATLKKVTWEDVPQAVYLPNWQNAAAKHARHLAGFQVGDMASVLAQVRPLATRINNGTPPIAPAGINE
ncbi:MAG: M48 family metallopeptidase [Anaerolineales bacterium]